MNSNWFSMFNGYCRDFQLLIHGCSTDLGRTRNWCSRIWEGSPKGLLRFPMEFALIFIWCWVVHLLKINWRTYQQPLNIHRKPIENPSQIHWKTIQIPLKINWKCIENLSKFHWKCIEIRSNPLKTHSKCIENPSEFHSKAIKN